MLKTEEFEELKLEQRSSYIYQLPENPIMFLVMSMLFCVITLLLIQNDSKEVLLAGGTSAFLNLYYLVMLIISFCSSKRTKRK